MKIDAHVHLLSRRNTFDDPDAFGDEGELLAAEMRDPRCRAGWQRANFEELLSSMDRNGIDKSLVFGFPWRSAERCRHDNDYVEECVARSQGRLIGLAVFQPLEGPAALSEVRQRLDSGHFRGVKIKAQWQAHSLCNAELWAPVLELVQQARGLALVHVEQFNKPPRGNGPYELLEFLRAFPDLRVIAAHFGAMAGMYFPYGPTRALLKNVLFDTSLGRCGEVAAAYSQMGLSAQMAFASDFPMHEQDAIWSQLEAHLSPAVLGQVAGPNLWSWLEEPW